MSNKGAERRIWDISQVLRPGLPVWPTDTKFKFARNWQIGPDCPVNVGRMEMSTHSGTHADAPLHYSEQGLDAASMALDPFLGECLVVDARGVSGAIEVADLPHIDHVERVLFRTWDRFPHEEWRADWLPIAADCVEWLALQGVRLIGTDAPSVDTQDSKQIAAHKAVLRHDMRILEGLVLDDVPQGLYELIALPLKIARGDAGLCRAILRELP